MTSLSALDHPRTSTLIASRDRDTPDPWLTTSVIIDDPKATTNARIDALAGALMATEKKRRDELEASGTSAAENRKLVKWVVGAVLTAAVGGGGFTGYRAVTGPEQVESSDVKAVVEAADEAADVRDAKAEEAVTKLRQRTDWNHREIEDLKVVQAESVDYIAEKIDAISSKAARVAEPKVITKAKQDAADIRAKRAEEDEGPNPFRK